MRSGVYFITALALVMRTAVAQEVLPDERDGDTQNSKGDIESKAHDEAVQLGGLPLYIDPESVLTTNIFLRRETANNPERAAERFLTLQIDLPEDLSAWEIQRISNAAEIPPSETVALGAEKARESYLVKAVSDLLDGESGAGCFFQRAVEDLPARLLVHFPASKFVDDVKRFDHQIPIGTVARVVFDETTTAITPADREVSYSQMVADGLWLTPFVEFSDASSKSITMANFDFKVLGQDGSNVVAFCSGPEAMKDAKTKWNVRPLSSDEFEQLSDGDRLWREYSLYIGKMPETQAFSKLPVAARVVSFSPGVISIKATDEMIANIKELKAFFVVPKSKQ